MHTTLEPEITITSRQALSPDKLRDLDAMIDLAFADEVHEEGHEDFPWKPPIFHLTASLGGQYISHVGLLPRRILAGDQFVMIGGIGGVATHPQWRGHGLARRLLELSTDFMRRDGRFEFGMLFCSVSMRVYYAKSGYYLVDVPLYIETSSGRRLLEAPMVLPLTSRPWPAGEIDVLGPPW